MPPPPSPSKNGYIHLIIKNCQAFEPDKMCIVVVGGAGALGTALIDVASSVRYLVFRKLNSKGKYLDGVY